MQIPKKNCIAPKSTCSGAQDRELLRQCKACATAPGPMTIARFPVGCTRPEQAYVMRQNLYLLKREADSPSVHTFRYGSGPDGDRRNPSRLYET